MAHDQRLKITATGPAQHLIAKRMDEICQDRCKDGTPYGMQKKATEALNSRDRDSISFADT